MKLPFFIALRYLKSRKKGLSFGTVISISGVALGVMALIVVISVISGFHEDLQKKNFRCPSPCSGAKLFWKYKGLQ
jgi:lipoprotein-releasing system permease protein